MNSIDLLSLSTIVVNKSYLGNNEEYLTKVTLRNRSEKDLFNIIIKNIIAPHTEPCTSSIKIDGKDDYGSHLSLGINIQRLDRGNDVEITYVLKTNLENGGEINNNLKVVYEYYDFEVNKYIQEEKEMECPTINVNTPNINNEHLFFKTNITNPDKGEPFLLTLKAKNTGNISLNNTKISIDLPYEVKREGDLVKLNGELVEIINGVSSIKVGKLDMGKDIDLEIPLIAIERTSNTLSKIRGKFSYDSFIRADEIRSGMEILKDISINVTSPSFSVIPVISDNTPIVNDIIELKYVIENKGNIKGVEGKLYLDIPTNFAIEDKSLLINQSKKDSSEILHGLLIGDLDPKEKGVVTMKLRCIETSKGELLKLSGRITYKFSSSDGEELKYKEDSLIDETISISNADCTLELTSDKGNLVLDDIITYTIKVKNIGTMEALNVTLKGDIPKDVAIEADELTIDNEKFLQGKISKGICVGNLNANEEKILTFKGRLESINSSRSLSVKVFGKFQYRNKKFTIKEKEIKEVCLVTNSEEALFKSFNIENVINTGDKSLSIKEILEVNSKVIIKDFYPVQGSGVVSSDGLGNSQVNKLIINGTVETLIEYISDDMDENIYLIENKEIFSTFIVLPMNYSRVDKVELNSKVLDNYTRIISSKSIYLLSNINFVGRIIR